MTLRQKGVSNKAENAINIFFASLARIRFTLFLWNGRFVFPFCENQVFIITPIESLNNIRCNAIGKIP